MSNIETEDEDNSIPWSIQGKDITAMAKTIQDNKEAPDDAAVTKNEPFSSLSEIQSKVQSFPASLSVIIAKKTITFSNPWQQRY